MTLTWCRRSIPLISGSKPWSASTAVTRGRFGRAALQSSCPAVSVTPPGYAPMVKAGNRRRLSPHRRVAVGAVRSVSYRLYPTVRQDRALTELLEIQRQLYNAALEERRGAWAWERAVTRYDQYNGLTGADEWCPELARFGRRVAQGTLDRLDEAFGHFLRRVRDGVNGSPAPAAATPPTLTPTPLRSSSPSPPAASPSPAHHQPHGPGRATATQPETADREVTNPCPRRRGSCTDPEVTASRYARAVLIALRLAAHSPAAVVVVVRAAVALVVWAGGPHPSRQSLLRGS
jgi:hypothetical protein